MNVIPIASLDNIVRDTLNWFDVDGNFCIGSKSNPGHVKQWREWHERMGFPIGNTLETEWKPIPKE